jgi:hypothetical protein
MAENDEKVMPGEDLVEDQIEEIDSSPPPQAGRSEDKEHDLDESKTEPEDPDGLEKIPPKEIASKEPQDSSVTPMQRQRKETILQKFIKRIPKINTPKVHTSDSLSSSSREEIPPPLPTNYPSTQEFLQRIEYRQQKHQFSAQKVEYYLRVWLLPRCSSSLCFTHPCLSLPQQAEQGNINVDEIVMKSSSAMTFVERR